MNIDRSRVASYGRNQIARLPVFDIVAQSWIQPRNAHPSSLHYYQTPSLHKRFFLIAKAFAQVVVAGLRNECGWSGSPLPKQANTLYVSHFLNEKQRKDATDNYFGDLPQKGDVIALLNHGWGRHHGKKPDWAKGMVPRIVLGRTSSVRSEISFLKRLRSAARKLTGPEELRALARKNAWLSANTHGMRTAQQVAALVKKLQPDILVTTFEGHVWERLCFKAARQIKPNIRCLGYHHTILFPDQYALAHRIGQGFDPDVILTAGSIAKRWFDAQPDWQETPVEPIGSVRHVPVREPMGGQECLVTPEGILSETQMLFNIALQAAVLRPDKTFRLRLHPVISQEAFVAKTPVFRDLPQNVAWSEEPLEQALTQAGLLLYRGSTVAITAALQGVRPVYLHTHDGSVRLDPLIDLHPWRQEISTAKQLASLFDLGVSDDIRRVAQTKAAKIFEPLNFARFKQILSS